MAVPLPVMTSESYKLIAVEFVEYVGTFTVFGKDHGTRADYVKNRLNNMWSLELQAQPVLLVISLSGIKVCSLDGEDVLMAHALKRISYATCDPEQSQFSFLARKPKGHFNLQYCHTFITESPQQSEELNTIVGNAFRLAYAAQLQKRSTENCSLSDITSLRQDSQKSTRSSDQDLCRNQKNSQDSNRTIWAERILSPNRDHPCLGPMNKVVTSQVKNVPPNSLGSSYRSPRSHGGKTSDPFPHSESLSLFDLKNHRSDPMLNHGDSNSPSSEESNSPTEWNKCKRYPDKPPLIKRLPIVGGPDDTCPLFPEQSEEGSTVILNSERSSLSAWSDDLKTQRGQNTREDENLRITVTSRPHVTKDDVGIPGSTYTLNAPPLPERSDSLCNEEENLRRAPWFQAGIPREIALEVLRHEPVGAFMVRESTTKPGCYALSLRVPGTDRNQSSITHYLILRTSKGYKIKGFTKEFSSLMALIVHHSVMPELLPCTLSLSRYNPSFLKTDTSQEFADVDPDYNTIAEFRRTFADMKL